MTHSSASSDPRTIVTPDAFILSKQLLGIPLASPSRRLLALLLDLIIIGFVQLLGGVVLGLVAAVVLFRIAFRREHGRPSRARRVAVGCMGAVVLAFVLLAVGVVPLIVRSALEDGVEDLVSIPTGRGAEGEEEVPAGLREALQYVERGLGFRNASSEDEMVDVGEEIGRAMMDQGVDEDEVGALLGALIPEDTDFDAARVVERVEARLAASSQPEVEAGPEGVPQAPASEAGAPSVVSMVERYASLDGDSSGAAERAALERRLAAIFAADTLQALADDNARLGRRMGTLRNQLEEMGTELEEARESGTLFTWIRDAADEAGLVFGWGTVYFTVFLVGWNGRTIGKRVLGLRVVRLNGEPMSWLMAFERAGGYAAGIATGLIGFAQVYWDANRQAIHDKIAQTVVVLEGAEPIPGSWEYAARRAGADDQLKGQPENGA